MYPDVEAKLYLTEIKRKFIKESLFTNHANSRNHIKGGA